MIDKLISSLPKSVDGVLIISETNRRYFTSFPSSDGILLATKNGSVFLTDSRYIEEAQNVVKCCEVAELRKVSEQLPELCKSFGVKVLIIGRTTFISTRRRASSSFPETPNTSSPRQSDGVL